MFDGLFEFFWKIIIGLVGAVYQLINYTYQVFLFLAQSNIFEQEVYESLTQKIYVILGVVMLFVIAYNILNLVIDPDKNDKGSSIEKLLKNIVISFILIVICPSLFSFAFRVQNSILNTNGGIINNFFASSYQENTGEDTIRAGGRRMAVTTFSAFFTPSNEGANPSSKSKNKSYTLKNGTVVNCSTKGSCNLEQAQQAAFELGTFSPYKSFAMNIVDEEVDFNWLIALIAGGYLVYVVVSFCFDLAVRACKLAFYQIIAPITITCRILPNQEDIFNKWFKATWKTYISLFIRILIMNLGIYLISVFIGKSNFFDSAACVDCSAGVKLIGYAFIILGIVTFIKQAPKLVDDIFGLGEDISLGIKDKIKNAGVFTAGATLGAGATALTRNAVHGFKNVQKAQGAGAKAAAAFRAVGSTFLGGASGAVRGFNAGKAAGSVSEMTGAAGKGSKGATDARDAREARKERYKASGNNVFTKSFVGGHIMDWGAGAKDWATGGASGFEGIIKVADQFKKAQDDMHADAEKVMNKFKANAGLVADMTELNPDGTLKNLFKGDNADDLLRMLQTDYAGMSLAAIEADLNRLKGVTNFESLVDKAAYTDATGHLDITAYQNEVNRVAREHATKVANLDSMYNQLWKQSRLKMEDAAMGNITIAGIAAKDLAATKAKAEEFKVLYESHGAHVEDPVTGEKITRPADTAKNIDDIAGAYGNVGSQARSESARVRQQAEARKGDSK